MSAFKYQWNQTIDVGTAGLLSKQWTSIRHILSLLVTANACVHVTAYVAVRRSLSTTYTAVVLGLLLRQYVSYQFGVWAAIQPISPRSDGSFVTKSFETHGTQRRAVCFKMCMLSAASPLYINAVHFSHEAPGASSRVLLKHTASSTVPSVSQCTSQRCVANIHPSIQPISPRSTGSFVTCFVNTILTEKKNLCEIGPVSSQTPHGVAIS